MNVGRSCRLREFILWTRREVYVLLALGIVPVCLYELAGWQWLAIPWTVVALIGTATTLIVSFNNTRTYARTVEAQQVWTSILNSSKAWGLMRRRRAWESTGRRANAEYQTFYAVPEKESPLDAELARYLEGDELRAVLASRSKATLLTANGCGW